MWRLVAPTVIAALIGVVMQVSAGDCFAAGPVAYTTNPIDNSASAVDVTTGTIVATIPVGNVPFGATALPSGQRVYVTNQFDTIVSVIDTTSNEVIDTVDVGAGQVGVAANPLGTRVYAATSNGVAVIDTGTHSVVDSLLPLTFTFGVAVSPDGTRLYVTTWSPGTLSVIDTSTHGVVATVNLGVGSPTGLAVHPAGTHVYVTNGIPSGSVSVVDTGSNTIVDTIPIAGGPIGVAINPAGTRAYVSTDSPSTKVVVIDTADNSIVTSIVLSNTFEAWGVAVHPAGTFVYVTAVDCLAGQGACSPGINGRLWTIDAATNTLVLPSVELGERARSFGQFVVGCNGDAQCNDGNNCTIDQCVDFQCARTCDEGASCGVICGAELVCQTNPADSSCICQLP